MEKEYSALDISLMDISVKPGDDFFRFVNGNWLKNSQIPSDRERWGSFDELRKITDQKTLQLIDDIETGVVATKDSDTNKAIAFIEVALNEERRNLVGFSPLSFLLKEISELSDLKTLGKFVDNHVKDGFASLLSFSVFPDLMNSSLNALYVNGPSLGLPERDYYLKKDEKDILIRKQYASYISSILAKTNYKHLSEQVLDFEVAMAKTLLSKEDSRNPQNIYHPTSIEKLDEQSKSLSWVSIVKSCGLDASIKPILTQKAYFSQLDQILSLFSIEVVKAYLTFSLLNSAAVFADSETEALHFDFYSKTLGGITEMKPRKERVLSVVNGLLGEAIGKLYVQQYFPEEAKSKAVELVQLVKEAFGERIHELSWMEDATKNKALDKLASFGVKIAYPDQWKDYSTLEVVSFSNNGSYLGNILLANKWKLSDDLAKVGHQVDKSEWHMAPQVVNAYYSPLNNEIVFPAAILQAPFYDFRADPAVNFGGIGAVIAHEMTHGFDDQGRRFDKEGNMIEWWSEQDAKQFEIQSKRLVEQADNFEIVEGLNLNGTFTLGENLADLGGVIIAYNALLKYQEQYGEIEKIDGFTQAQRFFMSWATVWRGKTRDQALRKQIATDPHPPFEFRALNPLANVEAFYEAFDVKETNAMYLKSSERAEVW